MTMLFMRKKVVVFDLDDTLYKEIEFLKSGYRKVSDFVKKRYGIDARTAYYQLLDWYHKGENAFARLNEQYGINNPIGDYINVYRYHHPSLKLSEGAKMTLTKLKEMEVILGIISDGREITQKQKIKALGLTEWIDWDCILINEDKNHFKPNHWSFDRMMLHCYKQYSCTALDFYYVGDNPTKDFLAPNELGWTTIMLEDNGKNIHKQETMTGAYVPKISIAEIERLIEIIA